MKNYHKIIIITILCSITGCNIINSRFNCPSTFTYLNYNNDIYHPDGNIKIKGSWELNLDKNTYYLDEELTINASWELNYNPDTQVSYVKIQIYDSQEVIKWESPIYDEIGAREENWTVLIKNLDLSFLDSSCILFITLYEYFNDPLNDSPIENYLLIIQVQILKRDISCELVGFNNLLKNGEDLSFFAKFFYETSKGSVLLVHQSIYFELVKEGMVLHTQNYKTDFNGLIQVKISNISEITEGYNLMRLYINNNSFFNSIELNYSLFIENNNFINHSIEIYIILLISVILIVSLTFLLIYRNIIRSRQKTLTELTIEF